MYIKAENRGLDKRVQKLRLGDMIARLNIPFKKYDEHTSDLDKECHIWACEHCPPIRTSASACSREKILIR